MGWRSLALVGAATLAACAAPSPEQGEQQPTPAAVVAPSAASPASRQALFGDLHLHTTQSFDAYVLMGTKTTPDEAYRFARGETINYLGSPIRRGEPLDFLAVTDHAENIGVFNELEDPNSAVSRSPLGRRVRAAMAAGALNITARRSGGEGGGDVSQAFALIQQLLQPSALGAVDTASLSASAWRRTIDAANANYQPGRFTTFIAYEWSSMPSGQNLHRNVIFRGDEAPLPFSSADSQRPEDLWAYLARIRAEGHEALAIPHNSNASNGVLYDWTTLEGRPIDAAYAQLRADNEPLSEIAQNKGTSETHPSLSPNDEFANFEIFDRLLISPQRSNVHGSYLRDALSRGLAIQGRVGVNPYRDGVVGASDLHGGLSTSSEADYGGNIGSANLGGGRPTREQAEQALAPARGQAFSAIITGSGALTGVWAEENTRESIYAAFRRRETFATSGTRIRVRFFGGWNLPSTLTREADWVSRAYAIAAPMGNDLAARPSAARSPSFVVWAQKDPNGANLDRVQIVKVWAGPDGAQHERIYDVAFEQGRRRDRATGRLAPIGDTVNAATATYENTIGSTEFLTVWRDPDFDPTLAAAYYVRVLEIPTPRWSTIISAQTGVPLPEGVGPSIQERAWSSPIWYTPR